jgi:hypothetical protein
LGVPYVPRTVAPQAALQFWDSKCDDDGVCGVETFDDEA